MSKGDPRAVELLRYHDNLVTARAPYQSLWQDIADYIMPKRGQVMFGKSPGRRGTEKLYDATGVQANELLASSMHGSLSSSAFQWFGLKMRHQQFNEQKVVTDWLEEDALRMHRALNQSNFASEQLEAYLDFCSFGTYAMFCQERPPLAGGKFGGLRFEALPIGSYVVDENDEGRVDTVGRQIEMTARALYAWFGNSLSARLVSMAKDRPTDKVTIVHLVLPVEDIERVKLKGALDPRTKKPYAFASVYMEVEQRKIIQVGGYRRFPFMVPRWSKMSGEVYGRGPGTIALPDVKTLNQGIMLKLKAWGKAIDPPLMSDDEQFIANARLTPAYVNYVRPNARVEPIESKSRFSDIQIEEESLKRQIRTTFYSDHLQIKESPQMTAEEVRTRYMLMQRLLGPVLGRLEAEALNPLIDRVFDLMYISGALDPAPDIITEAAKQDPSLGLIDVEYEGPLAKAQRADDVGAIVEILTAFGELQQTQVLPNIMDNFDADGAARHAAEVRGFPTRFILDAKKVQEKRDARAAANQEAIQAEKDRVASETEKNRGAAAASFAKAPMPPAGAGEEIEDLGEAEGLPS